MGDFTVRVLGIEPITNARSIVAFARVAIPTPHGEITLQGIAIKRAGGISHTSFRKPECDDRVRIYGPDSLCSAIEVAVLSAWAAHKAKRARHPLDAELPARYRAEVV